MTEDYKRAAHEEAQEAVRAAKEEARGEEEFWRRWMAGQQQETIRQNNLIYGSLVAIGLVMVQPFLTADSLDLAAQICVVAFAIAIPLLTALVMVNWQESFRRRVAGSRAVQFARAIGQSSALIGVAAGFWSILPAAGVAILIAGIVGITVHSVAFVRLEKEVAASPESAEDE